MRFGFCYCTSGLGTPSSKVVKWFLNDLRDSFSYKIQMLTSLVNLPAANFVKFKNSFHVEIHRNCQLDDTKLWRRAYMDTIGH